MVLRCLMFKIIVACCINTFIFKVSWSIFVCNVFFCRLLTLWFEYGQWTEVHDALIEGIKMIEKNTWLQVIPQLIARIDSKRTLVARIIHILLMDIGKTHPQALIYPLTVAKKSTSPLRRNAANKILKSMGEHWPTLVSQALMASEELIRVAILWHEMWHEGLEEASR